MPDLFAPPATDPVPPRFRGVWRRSLLRTPRSSDTDTTVRWLQASRWHADLRIPAGRPDFSGVTSLAECTSAQLQWLAAQEGFVGVTRVDAQNDDTAWLRLADFQPPSALPDAGHARFRDGMLVETGIHADYLEHWHKVAGSDDGFAVFRHIDAGRPSWLLVAGQCVMYVRPRDQGFAGAGWGQGEALRRQLDFEISFGERTLHGWTIRHSTLPWREGKSITVTLREHNEDAIIFDIDGEQSCWVVLEWTPPPA